MAGDLGLADPLRLPPCRSRHGEHGRRRRAAAGENIVTGQGRQAAPPELALPLSGAQADDEEIALYYTEHRDRVRRFLVSGCGCPEADAEDIIQDTIMVIRRRYWPTVRALDKPEAYWFKIAERRYRRTRGRQAGRPPT